MTVQSAQVASGQLIMERSRYLEGSTDARVQEWYPIGSRGGPEQPITEWDPCIVRPPSHLKNARCAKLRPFVFFFYSSWKTCWITEVEVGVRHFIRRIRFYLHSGQMMVSLTVSKIPMHPENLGTWQGYDLAWSGNIWGFTFTHLWYGVLRIYVVGVHFVHAASCRGKEKKKKHYHIDRHDDTRCTIVTDPM